MKKYYRSSARSPADECWHSSRRVLRKNKTDWAGISIGYCFKNDLDYYIRRIAKKKFYSLVKAVQKKTAKFTGMTDFTDFKPIVKAQLSPFFTYYPSNIAAYAALGLTAFLEYKERTKISIISTYYPDYFSDPATADNVEALPEYYNALVKVICQSIETRLSLEDLSKSESLSSVEIYRLFSASQQSLKFHTVADIIRVVICYGDIITLDGVDLHPVTQAIITDTYNASLPFFTEIENGNSSEYIGLGFDWVRSIGKELEKYLPHRNDAFKKAMKNYGSAKSDYYPHTDYLDDLDRIAPLDKPNVPQLPTPNNPISKVVMNMDDNDTISDNMGNIYGNREEVVKAIREFTQVAEKASGSQPNWEDKRSDLIEQDMDLFNVSEIQGEISDGHEVEVELGEGTDTFKGEIFDRQVELSDDDSAFDELIRSAQKITDAMRRQLFPNIVQVPEQENIKTTGSLNASRLAIGDVSEAIFKRYRIHDVADKRGRPVLLIAADGSGSLNRNQMRMLKLLTAAWLDSTSRTEIELLAGMYHSGNIRQYVSGVLVQWMYHPQKTLSVSKREGIRALAALPNGGTGCQSDAISIEFMLGEAKKIAQNRMVYLILITDCEWNRSFSTELSAEEEVRSVLASNYRKFADKLHITLVGLGCNSTGMENDVDQSIAISNAELCDEDKVAEKIGVYVASTLRERRKQIRKGK